MKWCCFRTTMCHFMPCSIVVANQPVICHYVCPCIRQAGSNIRRTLKHQHKDCSHETQFSETHHWWNNWSLSEGCLSDTTSRKAPVQGGGTHESTEEEKVTKSWADRQSGRWKWVWPLRVWKQQLGPWWQSGLWEFKSKGSEVGVSPHRGLGQEGRLWLSKHPQLYLYYLFSSPGLFQREERAVFQFPIRFGLCLLFPCSVSDNVFVSGATFTRGLCVGAVFTTERYRQCYCWKWREWWEVAWLFCLTCFPVGSTTREEQLKEQWHRGLGTTVWWKLWSSHSRSIKTFYWKYPLFSY